MRSTLDKLISWTGLVLAAVLAVAGGLLTWGAVFIGDQVDQQFSDQAIVMPEGPALEGLPDADRKALEPFAGEQLDDGPKARAYADHYIKAHMISSGEETLKAYPQERDHDGPVTYEEASGYGRALSAQVAEAGDKATPEQVAAAEAWMGQRESLFMGNTLRGLLLYGYAFATMGTIAGYAAIGAFVGAAIFLVLGLLGLAHSRKVARAEA
ncbi:hypothetical protein [Nocardioides daphniae]|uniref:Aromatic ring-opening dioxygenase LigA n=1 Tax=Nocardioides daphniae TaxID=402297 RepID=A0A4P7UGZ8_9ACTN|nr:hypothetical protein [Nocardioides daphniae]QCC77969.1 hypothetical protein E2C04_13675 [Nocardioides daphniae]GGD23491.1 hypothetical protein GCM10007231_23260 [Nocardioides daphniae]